MNEFCQDHPPLPDFPVPCQQVINKLLINANEPTNQESSEGRQEKPSPGMNLLPPQRGLTPLSQPFPALLISWISLSPSLGVSMWRKDHRGAGKSIFLPFLMNYPLLHPPPGTDFPPPGAELSTILPQLWGAEEEREKAAGAQH